MSSLNTGDFPKVPLTPSIQEAPTPPSSPANQDQRIKELEKKVDQLMKERQEKKV